MALNAKLRRLDVIPRVMGLPCRPSWAGEGRTGFKYSDLCLFPQGLSGAKRRCPAPGRELSCSLHVRVACESRGCCGLEDFPGSSKDVHCFNVSHISWLPILTTLWNSRQGHLSWELVREVKHIGTFFSCPWSFRGKTMMAWCTHANDIQLLTARSLSTSTCCSFL